MWRLIFFPFSLFAFIIVAALLLAAAVAAAGFVFPWFAFGLLAWGVLSLLRGPKQRRWSHRERRDGNWTGCGADRPSPLSRPLPPRAQPRPTSPPQARPAPLAAAPTEVPIDVQVKVEQIKRKVEVLLGFASRFPPFSKDLYLVRQSAAEYLPRTVQAYLALPAGMGEQVKVATGKTAHQELLEQLSLLDEKLDEIAQDLQRRDLDRLLANRKFLEDRLQSPTGDSHNGSAAHTSGPRTEQFV